MSFLLVHGLGLSSQIWSALTPLLPGDVHAVNLPGHGGRADADYDWSSVWADISHAVNPASWPETTLVLHSFTAALMPEVVQSGITPRKVILVEGILFAEDGSWTERISKLSDPEFDRWLEGFRAVSEMALKAQLVSRPDPKEITIWSEGFRIVSRTALRKFSVNLCKRIGESNHNRAIEAAPFPVRYVLGERTRLMNAKRQLLSQKAISVEQISRSGHFPMIDNPSELARLLIE